MNKLIRPPRLRPGDTIGVISPSSPGHIGLAEKYQSGIQYLQLLGFKVLEAPCQRLGRPATPAEKVRDLHAFWTNPEVKLVLASIGGLTSGTLLSQLDFSLLERNPKFLCGFSDITALHCGILSQTQVVSLYGPAVIATFGEMPQPAKTSLDSLYTQTGLKEATFPRSVPVPEEWCNEFVDAKKAGWKEKRKTWQKNPGWKVLRKGRAEGPILALNQNTLLSLVGTPFFPDLKDHILFLEQAALHPDYQERQLNQLRMMGVFRSIKGLVYSKAENWLNDMTPELHEEQLMDFVDLPNDCPLVMDFDCSHTQPILTMPQRIRFHLDATGDFAALNQLEIGYS